MEATVYLPQSRNAWGRPEFAAILKEELRRKAHALPLERWLAKTNMAMPETLEVMLISAEEADGRVLLRVGAFFSGLTVGCACVDDPTPLTPEPEYAEIVLMLDLSTGWAACAL
ncbi:MAG: hypothetical protein N2441_09280 [Rhodocyclaceae bacterium]|nr:hypothetical protein [Rhodocyclaceae bacterium]